MDMSVALETNVCPDEIVAAGSTITVTLPGSADPRSAQAAVRLLHGCAQRTAQVGLARRGRVLEIRVPSDVVGSCTVVVSELLASDGTRLVDALHLPFAVVPIAGTVPPSARIEHAVRVVVGELETTRLAPGTKAEGFVDIVKTVDRRTGVPQELAFDANGERVDAAALFAEQAKRRTAKYGRLHPTLYQRVERAAEADRIPIVAWPALSLPAAAYEKPSDRRSLEPPAAEAKTAALVKRAQDALFAVLERAKVKVAPSEQRPDDGVPCVAATATAKQIRMLAKDPAVGVVFFDDQTAFTDLGDSIAVARSDKAQAAGFDGTGIRVAVWEDGPKDLKNLVFAGRFTSSPSASDHARLTSAIVKNVERDKPHGHAPNCELYSANTKSTDALRWAVRDRHCTVVSQSFHRGSEPGGSDLQADDLLKDWLVLHWPYPTIVQAAGNFWKGDDDGIDPPESEYVNHKGFNSLAIGNHDDGASSMSGDSVFRNPASSHGDRELPELSANGTGVSANEQTMSGTSFAAPATAGVAAILQDVDGTLCSWPEGCRAILLAAAGRNVRDGTWWHDVMSRVDARDGSGALDAMAGVTIAKQRRFRDAPATRHGWDVGTLASSSFGADHLSTFRYRVKVPRLLLGPRVKVALAWDGAVTMFPLLDVPIASRLTVDFDLIVRDANGNQVASAASWDNSYEIAEFVPNAGAEYEIVIRRWSGTDSVWFGIAWTVTGTELVSTTATGLATAIL